MQDAHFRLFCVINAFLLTFICNQDPYLVLDCGSLAVFGCLVEYYHGVLRHVEDRLLSEFNHFNGLDLGMDNVEFEIERN